MEENITAAPATPDAAAVVPAAPPAKVPPPIAWTPGLVSIAVLLPILAFFLGSYRATNSDVWLSLAVGKLIAAGQYHFGVDPFSWASDGSYWANSSWLTSWLAYLIYEHLGPSSLVIAKALCIVALAGFLFATRSKDSPLLPALELTALALVVTSHRFALQSTVVSFVGFALLLWLLFRGGFLGGLGPDEPTKPGALWQIPLLFLAWSNLDGYFVLGLTMVALVAAGLAIFSATRAAAGRLAIAFAIAVVVCALNPHGLANFTLPTELAYLFHDVLPDSLTAAGVTAAAFNEGDPGFYAVISPFSSYAVINPTINSNFAGLGFYLLLMINIFSFVACGVVPGTKGLPARVLVCLTFGVLTAFQYRLTPFYAIVAGPIAVLNLTDYVRWSRMRAALPRGGVRFATLTTFVVMLGAVVLAWPGWLHQGLSLFREDIMFQASHRVEWELQPEPSLLNAALTLKKDVAAGQVHNVLNFVPEIAHYCAYFAPEVKCGLDQRLALFAPKASAYAGLRNDLFKEYPESSKTRAKPIDPTWPKTVADWKIDTLVLTHLHATNSGDLKALAQGLLHDATHWKPFFLDGQTQMCQYSPSGAWPADYLRAKWRREAFGAIPQDDWLPSESGQGPPREPIWLLQYARGPGQSPLETSTAVLDIRSFDKYSSQWLPPFFSAYQALHVLPAAGLSGTTPGTVLAVQAAEGMALGELLFKQRAGNQPTWFHSVDLGPPALPILATRELKKSIVKNTNSPLAHFLRATVIKQLTIPQEEWWCRGKTNTLRQNLQQVEFATAIRSAVTLAPWDFKMHLELADSLYDANYRDAALIHYAEALKAHLEIQVTDLNQMKYAQAERDYLGKLYKKREFDVKKRREDFDLKSAGMTDMDRFRQAVRKPWQYTDENNRVVSDPRGCGLALEGLSILERINPANLSEAEKMERTYFLVRLYCFQGRIDEAVETYTRAQKEFGFTDTGCIAWISAATGGYRSLDEALAAIEKNKAAEIAAKTEYSVRYPVMALGLNLHGNDALAAAVSAKVSQMLLLFQKDLLYQPNAELADVRTLRGSYALERGDTAQALAMFELALTNDQFFVDRAIAERFRDLIRHEASK